MKSLLYLGLLLPLIQGCHPVPKTPPSPIPVDILLSEEYLIDIERTMSPSALRSLQLELMSLQKHFQQKMKKLKEERRVALETTQESLKRRYIDAKKRRIHSEKLFARELNTIYTDEFARLIDYDPTYREELRKLRKKFHQVTDDAINRVKSPRIAKN